LTLFDVVQGPSQGRTRRLLAAADGADPDDLTLGEAARRLIALRTRLLGPIIEVIATCPHCAAAIDARINGPALAAVESQAADATVDLDGRSMAVRCLTVGDLDAVTTLGDPAAAAAELAVRAIGAPSAQSALSPSLRGEIESARSARSACRPHARAELRRLRFRLVGRARSGSAIRRGARDRSVA
jgi:hypothetical protein